MPRVSLLKPAVQTISTTLAGPRQQSNGQRLSSNDRGYGWRWRQYRSRWMQEHPLCGDRIEGSSTEHSECARQGRPVPATDLDHIEKVSGPQDPRFWDGTNHQSLCHTCHSVKTSSEDGGFGNAKGEKPARQVIGPDGWPVTAPR